MPADHSPATIHRSGLGEQWLVVAACSVRSVLLVLAACAVAGAVLASCGHHEARSSPLEHQAVKSGIAPGPVDVLPLPRVISLTSAPLLSVSCSASGYCLAEAMSDHFWLLVHGASPKAVKPAPVISSKNSLIGTGRVSCFSHQRCMAILFSRDVVELRGGQWLPAVEMSLGHILTGMGCSNSGACAAVDGLGDAYVFNGRSWSTALNGWGAAEHVVCESEQFCVAIGGGASQWNGETWTQPADIDPGATMTGVACASVSDCVVVDNRGRVIRWSTGHWSIPKQVTRAAFVGVTRLGDGQFLSLTNSGVLFLVGPNGAAKIGSLGSSADGFTGLACAPLGSDWVCYVISSLGVLYVQKIPAKVLE